MNRTLPPVEVEAMADAKPDVFERRLPLTLAILAQHVLGDLCARDKVGRVAKKGKDMGRINMQAVLRRRTRRPELLLPFGKRPLALPGPAERDVRHYGVALIAEVFEALRDPCPPRLEAGARRGFARCPHDEFAQKYGACTSVPHAIIAASVV
jgi:hypothetical protein